MLVSTRYAMSMLNVLIALHVSSRVWPMEDNSNPLTFCNRIRMESVGVFIRVSSKGTLFNFLIGFSFCLCWKCWWSYFSCWWGRGWVSVVDLSLFWFRFYCWLILIKSICSNWEMLLALAMGCWGLEEVWFGIVELLSDCVLIVPNMNSVWSFGL